MKFRTHPRSILNLLTKVWVALEHHGDGTARSLVEAMLARAGNRGLRSILATIRAGNERALGFYRKYGFVDADGVFPSYPGDTVLTKAVAAQ